MEALAGYRHKEFMGIEELTRAAASLVERFGAEHARDQARMTITERTVRHYLSEELLGQPAGQAGTSLVFNYGNLLRLLAVKKLLAEHWSVVKIKEFMTALDTTALEEMVGATLRANAPASDAQPESIKGEGAFGGAASERRGERSLASLAINGLWPSIARAPACAKRRADHLLQRSRVQGRHKLFDLDHGPVLRE